MELKPRGAKGEKPSAPTSQAGRIIGQCHAACCHCGDYRYDSFRRSLELLCPGRSRSLLQTRSQEPGSSGVRGLTGAYESPETVHTRLSVHFPGLCSFPQILKLESQQRGRTKAGLPRRPRSPTPSPSPAGVVAGALTSAHGLCHQFPGLREAPNGPLSIPTPPPPPAQGTSMLLGTGRSWTSWPP